MIPAEVAAAEDRLIAVYTQARQQTDATLAVLVNDPLRWSQRQRLIELQRRIVANLALVDQQAKFWVDNDLPHIYDMGIFDVQFGLSNFTQTPRAAVNELAKSTMDELLRSTQAMSESTKRFIRRVAQDELLQKLVQGRTVTEAGQRIAALLQEGGVNGVTYANGAVYGVDTYAAMLARTKSAMAYNLGTLNGAAGLGVDYFEVFDGPECGWTEHDDEDLAAGKIVTKADAAAHLIAHPNCRRSFGPRPDVRSQKEADSATPTPTEGQVLDQLNADLARQQVSNSARQARVSRVLNARRARLAKR